MPEGASRYLIDPQLDPAALPEPVSRAMMGDIIGTRQARVEIRVRIDAASPIERIDLRCGARTLETLRPYGEADLGRRFRVIWEGAEYRGRGRTTTWDGSLHVEGNRIDAFTPINFWHLDKRLASDGDAGLSWESVTTGNFAGAELLLESADEGSIRIDTPHVKTEVALGELGLEDLVFPAGGLARQLRVFRLPTVNTVRSFEFTRVVDIAEEGDSPIYVRVTLENGHQAWSSPIYFFRG